MSETCSRLSGQQQETVKRWLSAKDIMRCKACNLNDFASPTVMITLGCERGPSEHNVFMVPLSCGLCGNTVLLNAKTMGLL